MDGPIVEVQNISKLYRLGSISAGTFRESFSRWWERRRAAKSSEEISGELRSPEPETFWALRDLSFNVAPGEVIGIVGRNGAGKSTLLKILSRITEPSRGRAVLRGRVASLLEVGTGFHPDLTGRENIFLNGTMLGMKVAEVRTKFDEIVDFSGIEKFIDTPVKRYSSGMYVRLAFAVAAHLDPEILIVDEVLAVGDAHFQKKCIDKMGDVSKRGRTILFVSHNMNAVEDLCSRALLLRGGRLQADSHNVREVINTYLRDEHAPPDRSTWVNEENEYRNPYFQPLQFAVCDRDGQPITEPIRNDSDAWLQIEGTITTNDPALTVGYAIYTESGTLLYWSYQTDSAERSWPKLRPGRCKLRSQLPKHLLNEGLYRIELIGSLHFRSWLFEPGVNAPGIALRIQGGLSDSPHWLQKRAGLLAPVIHWELVEG